MVTCRAVPVSSPEAGAILRAYVTELVDRYHGRPMPVMLVDEALVDLHSDELAVFLMAYVAEAAVGCVGLRTVTPTIGEVKRMYVTPSARRRGIGTRLLDALDAEATARGLTELRLDTRSDLVEARALYARHGYTAVAAFNDDEYAHHWLAKPLPTAAGSAEPASAARPVNSR